MYNDITTIQQVNELLKAGIDPLSCNMIIRQDNQKSWRAEDNFNNRILDDFPTVSFNEQINYINEQNMAPAWTTGALLESIPDRQELTITLTRGGYDMSKLPGSYNDAYISDAYFAVFEYKDEKQKVYIKRTYGGDSYIESVVNLVVAYLTELKVQMESQG